MRTIAASPTRCPSRSADRLDLVDRSGALRDDPRARVDARQGHRPRGGWRSTSCCACSSRSCMRKRALERTSRGHRRTTSTASSCAASTTRLPFPLTGAQRRVIAEIAADLAGPHPMHRLLQGDVGSGKTVVAVIAAAHRGAGRAPGRADGADRGARRAARVGIRGAARRPRRCRTPEATCSATGRCGSSCSPTAPPAAERRRCWPGWPTGSVDIADRHARADPGGGRLPQSLGVGRDRRAAPLRRRAAGRAARQGRRAHVPDVLVMTATPIPRTAAMTVYGDLDVTVLDELPPGRTPIVTEWARRPARWKRTVWADVREEVAAGRQAYVVCPLIEESREARGARRREETFERLTARRAARACGSACCTGG